MNEINNLESTNKVINTEAKTIKQTSDKNSKQKEQITTNNNDRKTNHAKWIEYTEEAVINKIYPKYKIYKTSKIKSLMKRFIFTKRRNNWEKNWEWGNQLEGKCYCQGCDKEIKKPNYVGDSLDFGIIFYYSKKRGIKMICRDCWILTKNKPNKWILQYQTHYWCKNGCEGPNGKGVFQNGYQFEVFCKSCFLEKHPKKYRSLLFRKKWKNYFWYTKNWIIYKCKILLTFFRLYNPWKENKISLDERRNKKCDWCQKESWWFYWNHLKPASEELLICLACYQKANDNRKTQLIGIGSILVGLMVLVVTIIKLI